MKTPVQTPVAGSAKQKGDEVAPGTPQSGEAICPACKGTGQKDEAPCAECGGSGKIIALVGDA